MLKTFSSISIAAAFSLAIAACSPSINPALKKSVDGQIANLQASSQVYSLEDGPSPGYASGQWLKYKSIDDKGNPSFTTQNILEVSGDIHKIETVSETYYNRTVHYIELRYQLGMPVDSMEILRVVHSTDGEQAQEASPMELSMTNSTYKSLVSQIFVSLPPPGSEEIQTAAGKFVGCSQQDVTLSMGFLSYQAKTWHHPSVPGNGMVRSERVDGSTGTTELVAFGLSGARSELLQ